MYCRCGIQLVCPIFIIRHNSDQKPTVSNMTMVLSYRCVPDQQLRTSLALAVLGDKNISMFLYGDAEEVGLQLIQHFPSLVGGSGYELLRCSDRGGRDLVVIDMPPGGYTPDFLKAVTTSAKLYIRSLQHSLD